MALPAWVKEISTSIRRTFSPGGDEEEEEDELGDVEEEVDVEMGTGAAESDLPAISAYAVSYGGD
jgi:hypothetical protein